MSSPSELALDERSFNAFYLATFKYSSVWYSVLPIDATDFSLSSKMELVKCFYMTGVPGPRFPYKSVVHEKHQALDTETSVI